MINLSSLDEQVKNLYVDMGIKDPRDLDMFSIAEKLGIKLLFWELNSRAVFFNKQPFIFVNSNLKETEQWFDFAHELGHILKHVGDQTSMTRSLILFQEEQANDFACRFLVPTHILNQVCFSYNRELAIRFIKEIFPVSEKVARKRFRQYTTKAISQEHLYYDFM